MKRPVKLAIMAGILAAFVTATLLLNAGNARREAEELAEMTVFTSEADNITVLGWTYAGDSMRFERDGEGWVLQYEPDFPLDSPKVENALDSISSIVAHKGFEPEAGLSEYGLETPEWEIECSMADGSSCVLSIGAETELDGYRYFSNGDGKVYLVDSSLTENFTYALLEMAVQEQLPAMTDMKSLTVTADGVHYRINREKSDGDDGSESFSLEYPDAEPSASPLVLDASLADDFAKTVTYNLFWQSTAGWRCSDEELSSFGLDEPCMKIDVVYYSPEKVDTGMLADDGGPIYDTVYNEEEFHLNIGCGSDGQYYACIAGSDLVYLISSSVYDTLFSMTPEALVSEP